MDRKLEQKNVKLKKWGFGAALAVAVAGYGTYLATANVTPEIDTERITIRSVSLGNFQETLPVNGVIMPLTTIFLDVMEGGRVEEKFVEDGAMMRKGDPILRLGNTDLELSLASQETQVYNVLTQMNISKNNATQNSILKLNQMAEVDNALKEAERVYLLNQRLYEDKVLSLQELKQSENAYHYQVRRKKLTDDILAQDQEVIGLMKQQDKESLSKMQSTLALMRKKVSDLIVRAPIDGKLTSLDAEIGQLKSKGERLGQIDITDGYKIRADIDEFYINRIYTDLPASAIVGGKTYKLRIKKVYSQVTGGRFQVDLQFEIDRPEILRRGQTLQVILALSDQTQALLLPKGGFYNKTGGNWIFKLSPDGKRAYKTEITINRNNPDFYEVTTGLKEGDRVITSSYENFENRDELVLNQ
jgi:HlyD family secretion protein